MVTVLKEESQILKVWDLIYNLPRRFQILVGAMDEDKALHSWNPGMFKPNFGISRPFLVLTSPKLFLDTDNRVSLRFEFQVPYKLWTIKFRDTKLSTLIPGLTYSLLCTYRIVASRSTSWLVTCLGLFRLLMKGIFGPYVL